MAKTKARKMSKTVPEESGMYEITVMWKNEDRQKGDAIIEEATICATKPYVRKYIERLAKKLSLGGGRWEWMGKIPVYMQKDGTKEDHYITYEQIC